MSLPRQQIVETGDFAGEVRPAIKTITHSRQLFDIYRLTYACYMDQTMHLPSPANLWIPYPNFDHIPETEILVAVMVSGFRLTEKILMLFILNTRVHMLHA